MARVAENREPAQPVSQDQKDRYQRILRAAARLGSQYGHERMQMTDVAKEAGVAIATLYRYFPSKNDLFVGLLQSQVEKLPVGPVPDRHRTPSEAVAETLLRSSEKLLARPLLATAMLQANNHAQLQHGREGSVPSQSFHRVLYRALGVDEPSDHDRRLVRLIEQSWYGVLISVLNNVITPEEAEDDVRLTCRLILGPTYDSAPEGAMKEN